MATVIVLLLVLAGGLWPAAAEAAGRPVRPRQVTQRGLSQDLEFNLWALNRAGYLSSAKVTAILKAVKDGSFQKSVTLPDNWAGRNYWVDRLGRVHTRSNGPGGLYYAARDPAPLVVDIISTRLGTFLVRNSCFNLMVGPVPKPSPKPCPTPPPPPPPCQGQVCFQKRLTSSGGSLAGHRIRVKRLNPVGTAGGYEVELETDQHGLARLPDSTSSDSRLHPLLAEGDYSWEELPRPSYRPVGKRSGTFRISRTQQKWEIEICNEFVPTPPPPPPPPPAPDYNSEAEQRKVPPPPPPPPVAIPGRVSGYFPGAPSREIRSQAVGVVGVVPRSVNRVNKRVIRRPAAPPRPQPPAGPVPPGLGQPPADPASGRPPSGVRPPGS